MEYGLWLNSTSFRKRTGVVLILVLMEYGLWPTAIILKVYEKPS